MPTPVIQTATLPPSGVGLDLPAHRSGGRARAFAAVEVHSEPRAALDAWRLLALAAPASPYQSPDWMLPWIETVGAESGHAPRIVVARDAEGRPSALLPLGLSRRAGLAVATFLGAKDSNFNMGLFRPGPDWTGEAIRALLAAAARQAGIDLYAFRNQPHEWQGQANPMAALPHQPSPSFAYKTAIARDPEAVLRGLLSRDTRKKLRQKLNRLRALGPVSLVVSSDPGVTAELLDAFAAQREARNAASGIGTGDLPGLRRFLDRAAGAGGPVTVFGLRCGGRIVATMAGTRARGRFCGMLTSFDADPEVARTSPGELLLSEVLALHCVEGFDTFDLGIGEARYKESYCPEVQPLFDSLVGVTPLGRLYAHAEAGRLQLKRSVKQSRWAWPLAQRLRRLRAA
ncbi:GNAT family N-acetyltransferase [Lichenibacterium dinghuense]|uniref:GNAT family N-acetyltransferase n=1 Tax=Lichenibacterium dinghuense TaxID=2895977 RepID=UPI001F1F8D1E|nr:GNAT family N-acetyltransferase [Lichenibacterium sp. 6Y81]